MWKAWAPAAVFTLAIFLVGVGRKGQPADTFPVQIDVDLDHKLGPLRPIWRFFGCDEPNYATMPNGAKLMKELGHLKPKQVFFRTHNLFTTGDGKPALKWGSTNAYTEDANGKPVYDWKILDRIFDTYHRSGVRPYVEIGFMPEAMSIHPEPYQHHWTATAAYDEIYTGWTYPPKSYQAWSDLVYAWAQHCIDRYGRREVEQWYWEAWNEPNIGYWHGTQEEFFKLHDFAVAGVRRALPTAKIGGPDTAGGGAYLREFIQHCDSGASLDFVSFHAKGAPTYVDGHVRMGISAQLKTVDQNFRLIASFPELKGKPIIIGESDPEGCAACQGPTVGYRNGTMYSSYTAAVFARKLDLAAKYGVNLEGALTWAFTFEDQPYFAGFRQLASEGIDLPVLNVFRMFSMMDGDRVSATSTSAIPLEEIVQNGVRDHPDISALAARHGNQAAIIVWHYHDDDLPGPAAAVSLRAHGLPGDRVTVKEFLIDQDHSNSYAAWLKMGSPQRPTAEQILALERAGDLQLAEPARTEKVVGGTVELRASLSRQAVALFVLKY